VCKKSKGFCSELGQEPSKWSAFAPLTPPAWFEGQAVLLCEAAEEAANGRREKAIGILGQIRGHEMYEWFDVHGQNSGWHRANWFKIAAVKISPEEMDSIRSPVAYEKQVYERDGYKCRYCGLKVIAKQTLVAFEKTVGTVEFRTVGRNIEQHGIVHAFKPVADHVFPHRLGGRTNLDNLITSCPACNYGKAHYSIEQLGIEDPRTRPAQPTADWNGLISLLPRLKQHQIVSAKAMSESELNLPISNDVKQDGQESLPSK
jgi:DNA-directed RNA polymerase subunit RPC12/RpoP